MRTTRSLVPLMEAAKTVPIFSRGSLKAVQPEIDVKRLTNGCFACEHAVGAIDGGRTMATVGLGRNEEADPEIAFTLSRNDVGVKKSLANPDWWLRSITNGRPQGDWYAPARFDATRGDNWLRPYVRLVWKDGTLRHVNARIDLADIIRDILEDEGEVYINTIAFNYFGVYLEPSGDLSFWREWTADDITRYVHFSYEGFTSMSSRKTFVAGQWPTLLNGQLELTPLLKVGKIPLQRLEEPRMDPRFVREGEIRYATNPTQAFMTEPAADTNAAIRWDDIARRAGVIE